MVIISQDMIQQFQKLIDSIDEPLKFTFENMHQGYPTETLVRFLKARDGNVCKAHKMLIDCLNWRIENEIDDILAKPIIPTDLYRGVRDSQLIGMSGYSKEGLPVIAVGVGLSMYDKASIHYYVQSHIQINEYRDRVILPSATEKFGRHISTCLKILDMTGLKLSALNQIKVHLNLSNQTDRILGPFEVWLSLSDSQEEKVVMVDGLQKMVTEEQLATLFSGYGQPLGFTPFFACVRCSAAIVTAYLMKTERLSQEDALESLQQCCESVCPNDGFIDQLKMFEEMGFKVDHANPIYKRFRLKVLDENAFISCGGNAHFHFPQGSEYSGKGCGC